MDWLTHIALGSASGMATMAPRTALWKAALWGAEEAATLPDLDAVIDRGNAIRNRCCTAPKPTRCSR